MINIIILIIFIIFIILFLSIFFYKKNNNETTYINEISNKPDDILLHLSSETETILRSLNNLLHYDTNVTFISLNQISTNNSYDNGIDKFNIDDIIDYDTKITNYKTHYIQGFTEIKDNDNYLAHKITGSVPIDKPIKLVGKNGNFCYIMYLKRLKDDKKFYYIQMSQKYKGNYKNDKGYVAISEFLQYIKQNYPGEYVITGNFNVHGHEKVFEYWLGSYRYHICEFYNYATLNDEEYIASPSGIIISKELYKKVEYFIDIYPGYSYKHYLIGAKLYIDNKEIETKNIISQNFLNLLKEVKNITSITNLMGDPGNYVPVIDTPSTVSIDDMVKSNQLVYTNNETSELFQKINN